MKFKTVNSLSSRDYMPSSNLHILYFTVACIVRIIICGLGKNEKEKRKKAIAKKSIMSRNEKEKNESRAEISKILRCLAAGDFEGSSTIDISNLHTLCSFFYMLRADFARFSFPCRRGENFLRVLVQRLCPQNFPDFMGSFSPRNCTHSLSWLFTREEQQRIASMRYDRKRDVEGRLS